MYRAEATTIEGFVQQLSCYIASGYRWYVTGLVPEQKEPSAVDERLVEKYEIDLSKYQRARRKRRGKANVQYLRIGRFFVVIATPPIGGHSFTRLEQNALRDIRKQPVRIAGYSISSRRDGSALSEGVERWRVHVRIDREAFLDLREFCLDAALRKRRVELEDSLSKVPFEPYAPIRRQLLSILGQVNRRRESSGLRPLRSSCLRFRRRPVRPFDPPAAQDDGRAGLSMLMLIVVLALAWRYDLLPWALGSIFALFVHRLR